MHWRLIAVTFPLMRFKPAPLIRNRQSALIQVANGKEKMRRRQAPSAGENINHRFRVSKICAIGAKRLLRGQSNLAFYRMMCSNLKYNYEFIMVRAFFITVL